MQSHSKLQTNFWSRIFSKDNQNLMTCAEYLHKKFLIILMIGRLKFGIIIKLFPISSFTKDKLKKTCSKQNIKQWR